VESSKVSEKGGGKREAEETEKPVRFAEGGGKELRKGGLTIGETTSPSKERGERVGATSWRTSRRTRRALAWMSRKVELSQKDGTVMQIVDHG